MIAAQRQSVAPVLDLLQVSAAFAGRPILRDVSLQIAPAETLAVVGPSGAGKSTLARLVVGLVPASGGLIRVAGRPQIVFQDPQRSLDPAMRIAALVTEGLELSGAAPRWGGGRGAWRRDTAAHWLRRVGLDPDLGSRFPAQLSGGQLQRVAIARAAAPLPRLLVADEALAALDVSTGAQILDLLRDLQLEFGLAYLFITHNPAQIAAFAHRIAVMEIGAIVESGTTADILAHPCHPRTRCLLAAFPPWPG